MASASSGTSSGRSRRVGTRKFDHIDPVEQIFTKFTFGDQVREILVRGRQETHIDGHLELFTHRAHGLFLDDAQQLDLHVQRQIGDFVQKQSSAFGRLNQSLLVADGARETAALVAEQFAFHEFGGNGAAIDGYERAVAARAGFVDELGDQFLPRAGFSGNMHRRLAARHARRSFRACAAWPAMRRAAADRRRWCRRPCLPTA